MISDIKPISDLDNFDFSTYLILFFEENKVVDIFDSGIKILRNDDYIKVWFTINYSIPNDIFYKPRKKNIFLKNIFMKKHIVGGKKWVM